MDVERWQRVKHVFDVAVLLRVEERAACLDTACGVDRELRTEVESLLAAHDQAGTGFLKKPAVDLSAAAPALPSRTGLRIGVYQILEEIGHGGMGEVYRAVRADGQYTKEVAIKVVRGGYDSRSLLERFRNERQILASLDHPNIARLLDGGTTEDGIPYLVMELIEGKRIDRYCDDKKLSITDRLKLFRQVCSAVQYAHQHLVIHRDIKPGNILVTTDGVPKLLDFGIAKILDPSAGSETTMARPMTPEYASPEQVRGESITTASDVYSLGVVLYLLLTGRSPYPGETRSSHDLSRAICDTEPTRPSSSIFKPPVQMEAVPEITPEQLSSARDASPAKLRRRLAGDLDNIVLMALRKEPQRRYQSVEQFAEDIRRHIDGLPVGATKGSWRYRAGKYVRRHRAALAGSALVALAIAGGVAATIRQARIATAERVRAVKRFNDVRTLANSLIFEIHDSIQNLPGATPSRKLLLDRAVEYLDKLSQDSGGDVDLQRELAWGYQRLSAVQGDTSQSNLGQISAAEVSVKKSIALFEAVARANPHNLSDQMNLAMAYRRRAFVDVYERTGRQEIEQALAITAPVMKTDGGKPEVRNERSLEVQILASVQDATGERLKAIDTFRNYVELRRDILRTNPGFKGIQRSVAHSTIELAHELGRFGDRAEALQLMNEGIAQMESLAKEAGTPDVIRDLAASELRRGEVEIFSGDTAASIADFERARDRTARLAKLDPQNTMLQSDMCGFDWDEGRSLIVSGRAADGLRLVQKSLKCFEDLHLEADTGPGVSLQESWIGEAQVRLHNLPEALKQFEHAAPPLAADIGRYDDARCDLAMVETKIGNTLLAMGKASEALAHYAKALETADLHFSIEHMDIPSLYAAAEAYAGMGDIAAARGRQAKDATERTASQAEARADYEKSLNILKQIPFPSQVTGNGYLVRSSQKVAQQLASLGR